MWDMSALSIAEDLTVVTRVHVTTSNEVRLEPKPQVKQEFFNVELFVGLPYCLCVCPLFSHVSLDKEI